MRLAAAFAAVLSLRNAVLTLRNIVSRVGERFRATVSQ